MHEGVDQDARRGQLLASRVNEDELVSVSENRLKCNRIWGARKPIISFLHVGIWADIRQRLIAAARRLQDGFTHIQFLVR